MCPQDGPHAALGLALVVDEGLNLSAGLGLSDDRGYWARPAYWLALSSHIFLVSGLVFSWDFARILREDLGTQWAGRALVLPGLAREPTKPACAIPPFGI